MANDTHRGGAAAGGCGTPKAPSRIAREGFLAEGGVARPNPGSCPRRAHQPRVRTPAAKGRACGTGEGDGQPGPSRPRTRGGLCCLPGSPPALASPGPRTSHGALEETATVEDARGRAGCAPPKAGPGLRSRATSPTHGRDGTRERDRQGTPRPSGRGRGDPLHLTDSTPPTDAAAQLPAGVTSTEGSPGAGNDTTGSASGT